MLIRESNISPSSQKRDLILIDAGYFLTREVVRALCAEGHGVVVIPFHMPTNAYLPDPKIYSIFLNNVIGACEKYSPDALITINHLGFDTEGRLVELLETLDLPSLIWYVDSPRYILLDHQNNVSDLAGIFLWDRSYVSWMKQIGFTHVAELPLATDPEIFHPELEGLNLNNSSTPSALTFVGDSMKFAVERANLKLQPALAELIFESDLDSPTIWASQFCNNLINKQLAQRKPGWTILQELQEQSPDSNPSIHEDSSRYSSLDWLNLESTLVLLATRVYRENVLKQLTASEEVEKFQIFGDEGWRKILNGKTEIFPQVDYYTKLSQLYQRAGGIVNLTGFQMPHALNQRCYDVPAAGGFILTDDQPAILEQFDVGDEIVTFSSSEDLINKWLYFQQNSTERKARIEKCRQRVLNEHTYRHRVRRMLDCANQWYWT